MQSQNRINRWVFIVVMCLATPLAAWGALNDTGITTCSDATTNGLPCPVDGFPNQDAEHGRDAAAVAGTLVKIGGGAAGFDFTKISNSGAELPADATLGSGPNDWACTRDNVTGAIWEVKTSDGGLRDQNHTYSWYDSNSTDGNLGTGSGGTCFQSGRCDTEKFVQDVNGAGLCGFNDWRMPTPKELFGILNHGIFNPTIDGNYFSNTINDWFWSDSPLIDGPNFSWRVYVSDGYTSNISRNAGGHVRLIRGEKSVGTFIDNHDGTITQINTGLMWAKCSEGQTGVNCTGDASNMNWQTALTTANNATLGGYTDWRLPNIKELQALMDYSRLIAIDPTYFPNMPNDWNGWFWSSSPYGYNSSNKTFAVHSNGDTYGGIERTLTYYHARLVRNVSTPTPPTPITNSITGIVTDAATGLPLANVTVSIAGQSTTTDSSGRYTLTNVLTNSLDADFYADNTNGTAPHTVNFHDTSTTQSITAELAGYVPYRQSIAPGIETLDISISQPLAAGAMRFVLTWGETPRDLDSHLLTPNINGSSYRVYFGNRGNAAAAPFVTLDVDDTSSYGPETVTISRLFNGTYVYYVHNYSGSPELQTSGAAAQLYDDQGLHYSLNIPTTGLGRYWYIGTIDGTTGQFTVINCIQESAPTTNSSAPTCTPTSVVTNPAAPQITAWLWDFGDGTTATVQHPQHIYTAAGDYTVRLLVTNSDGITDAAVKTSYVHVTAPVTLTINKIGAGSVTSGDGIISCGGTCSAGYTSASSVILTATPDAGLAFTGWSGGGCSGTGTCTVTMTASQNVTANFAPLYALTVTKTGGGTGNVTSNTGGISCDPTCSQNYASGSIVVLTASATAGAAFTGWSGGGCAGLSTCTVTMSAAQNVTANFAPLYALTVTPVSNGTVTSGDGTINCGGDCSENYVSGSAVVLTATASGSAIFTGWSGGGCTGTMATCTVSMNAAKTVSAIFKPRYTLTVTPAGAGSGSVTSSPKGITCGGDCSEDYTSGASVTLTAKAAAGSNFAGWSGGCTGTATSCTVTVDAAKSVTATFQPQTFALTVALVGSGTVTSADTNINCGSDCSENYTRGTSVTLTAAGTSSSTFSGWAGACRGTATTCTVPMTAAKNVTATFKPKYTLTVTPAGNGSGSVTSSPTGISCGSTCSAGYTSGTSVKLTAKTVSGSEFAGWSGACSGVAKVCTVNMSAAKSVTATFQTQTFKLAVSVSGAGTVTSGDGGISCGSDCSDNYSRATSVTLTATANSGAVFSGWAGACRSKTATCSVPMTAAKTVTASFATTYPLNVTLAGAGTGTVSSAPTGISCGRDCDQNYVSGTTVKLTAKAGAKMLFTGWSGACSGLTTTCNVTMSAARNVTATFMPEYKLTVNRVGGGSVNISPAGINCGSRSTGTDCRLYSAATPVTLIATPTATTSFKNWSGSCAGTSPTCTLTVNAAKNVTANFVTGYPLTVTVNGSGSVTSQPTGISCPGICQYSFAAKTVVLTANPNPGKTLNWDVCPGTINARKRTCTVTVNKAQTAKVRFY